MTYFATPASRQTLSNHKATETVSSPCLVSPELILMLSRDGGISKVSKYHTYKHQKTLSWLLLIKVLSHPGHGKSNSCIVGNGVT